MDDSERVSFRCGETQKRSQRIKNLNSILLHYARLDSHCTSLHAVTLIHRDRLFFRISSTEKVHRGVGHNLCIGRGSHLLPHMPLKSLSHFKPQRNSLHCQFVLSSYLILADSFSVRVISLLRKCSVLYSLILTLSLFLSLETVSFFLCSEDLSMGVIHRCDDLIIVPLSKVKDEIEALSAPSSPGGGPHHPHRHSLLQSSHNFDMVACCRRRDEGIC